MSKYRDAILDALAHDTGRKGLTRQGIYASMRDDFGTDFKVQYARHAITAGVKNGTIILDGKTYKLSKEAKAALKRKDPKDKAAKSDQSSKGKKKETAAGKSGKQNGKPTMVNLQGGARKRAPDKK